MTDVVKTAFNVAFGKVDLRFKNAHKVNLVRYADDFIVTAATEEIALEAKELIKDFLKTRGLELSDEKTVVTHINSGFDILRMSSFRPSPQQFVENII